jgi:hypothetical protein
MLPVTKSWYGIHTAGPGISRILESHVAPWMRCNMWLVHGRDRDLLIDSGMGLKPLKVARAACHCHLQPLPFRSHGLFLRVRHPPRPSQRSSNPRFAGPRQHLRARMDRRGIADGDSP